MILDLYKVLHYQSSNSFVFDLISDHIFDISAPLWSRPDTFDHRWFWPPSAAPASVVWCRWSCSCHRRQGCPSGNAPCRVCCRTSERSCSRSTPTWPVEDKRSSQYDKEFIVLLKENVFVFAYSAGFVALAAELCLCLGGRSVWLKRHQAGRTAEVLHGSFNVHCSHDEV